MHEFPRIKRLPPYVFNITGELKAAARRRGEDIIDFGMGNPDQPTPKHIVDKLVESAQRPDTHRYSVSKGIPRLRRAIANWYKSRYQVELDPDSEAIATIERVEREHMDIAVDIAGCAPWRIGIRKVARAAANTGGTQARGMCSCVSSACPRMRPSRVRSYGNNITERASSQARVVGVWTETREEFIASRSSVTASVGRPRDTKISAMRGGISVQSGRFRAAAR